MNITEAIAFQLGVLKANGEAITLLMKLLAEGKEGLDLLAEFSQELTTKPFPELRT